MYPQYCCRWQHVARMPHLLALTSWSITSSLLKGAGISLHTRMPVLVLIVALACCTVLVQACGGGAPATATVENDAAGTSATQDSTVGSAATAPSAPLKGGKVGEPVEAYDVTIMITNVRTEAAMPNGQKARVDNVFLLVDVMLENVSADGVNYSHLAFQAKDGDGKTYSVALTMDSKSLRQGALAKGEKVEGYLAFDVSKTAKGFVLDYNRSGFGTITIQLS
jgi:hypothetical protein